MNCPTCEGFREIRAHTPGLGPGSGDIGMLVECPTCEGTGDIPSNADLKKLIEALSKRIASLEARMPRRIRQGYQPRRPYRS